MSVTVGQYVSCASVQEHLMAGDFTQFDPTNNREVPAFLRLLVSSLNTQNVIQRQINVGNGHTKSVQLIYRPRLLEEAASTSRLEACTTGDSGGNISETYSIDTSVGTWAKETIELADLQDTCENDSYFVAQTINKLIDVVVRKMATTTVTEASALFGKHVSTNSTNAVTGATEDASGNYVQDLIRKMQYEMRLLELGGLKPFAIGGSEAWNAFITSVSYACCTDAMNIDLAAYNSAVGPAPVFDYRTEAGWGSDIVGMYVPGALQLLTYNINMGERGIRMIDTETEKVGVITDPLTGLTFDYEAKYDCKKWTFTVGTAHQLVGMPDDLFLNGDRLDGVKYFSKFQIVNPS